MSKKEHFQELENLKKTYHETEQLSNDKMFKAKIKIYKDQIQDLTKIDQFTNDNFAIKHIYTDFLQRTYLNDHPKFKQIKQIFKDYNRQVQLSNEKQKAGKSQHLKTIVMDQMIKFMDLMLLSPNYKTKVQILETSYLWFMKKLKKENRKLKGQQEQKIIQSQIILNGPQKQKQKTLCQKVQEQIKYYKKNNRTAYKQIDPPEQQLNNYFLHHFLTQKNKQKTSDITTPKNWMDRLNFASPLKKNISENQLNQTFLIAQTIKKDIIQLVQDKNTIQNELEIGRNQDDQQEESQKELDQDKNDQKKGVLDPLVKIFLIQRIRQKSKSQFKANQKYQRYVNNSLVQKNEDLDAIKNIQSWASHKSRWQTQSKRKLESRKIYNSNFITTKKRMNTIEDDINSMRVNSSILSAKFYLPEIKRQSLNTEKGFSIHDRKRTKTEIVSYSSMIEQNKRLKTQQKNLDEIENIKNKFSRYKIYVPIKKLQGGLLHPNQKSQEKTSLLDLPLPQLLSNPFAKLSKKKKKKKKK